MIEVSDAWKNVQQRFLLPESYIEIDCSITDAEAQSVATASGSTEAGFSNVSAVLGEPVGRSKYVTNELNLWSLDGTHDILPDNAPYGDTGYVSNIASTGSVTLTFPTVRTTPISGVTITWSEIFGEYPSVFTVTAKNGDTVVAETTITDNMVQTSAVFLEMVNYNSITITVHDWCLPNRRARIEKLIVGHVLTFSKGDLIGFKHEQTGDLLSGELPKSSVEFVLNNLDGRWNPNNPNGMVQYLSERQKVVVRYAMDVNGTLEWMNAGTFYLSEWDVSANGFEARFTARDAFEFLMNTDMKGRVIEETLEGLAGIVWQVMDPLIPDGARVLMDDVLRSTASVKLDLAESITAAEIVQKCANATGCVLRYDRDGVLQIRPLDKTLSDYRIATAMSYSHPEVSLTRPLRSVTVDFGGEEPYTLTVSPNGENQTVTNDYIAYGIGANRIASWVRDILKSRKVVRGEFRADPRLDLFDVVTVESKYGEITPVVITNITYTFNGSFQGTYEGRVLGVTQ